MAKILLADDSRTIREAVSALLQSELHSVVTAQNGCEAVKLYNQYHPDLLILDVVMPLKNGFDVCSQIRSVDPHIPVLFLTGRSDENDKVLGLGIGADDYVTKPFGTKEFLARVRALLRRTMSTKTVTNYEEDTTPEFRIGPVIVSERENVMHTQSGSAIQLTYRECKMLKLFHQYQDQIVSKEKISVLAWGEVYNPLSRTIDQYVSRLRRKLEQCGVRIVAFPRNGFRFEFINGCFKRNIRSKKTNKQKQKKERQSHEYYNP